MADAWVQRVFDRLSGAFGARFADLWAGVKAEVVRDTWARGLAGLTGPQIAQGIKRAIQQRYAPTLADFRALCLDRHDLPDDEAAYIAAIRYASHINRNLAPPETHPAVMAAARDAGTHPLLNLPDDQSRKRFSYHYAHAKAQFAAGNLHPEAPRAAPALGHYARPEGDDLTAWTALCRRMWADQKLRDAEMPRLERVIKGEQSSTAYIRDWQARDGGAA